VGGCCGTTPEHIKRISDMIATTQPRLGAVVVERHAVQAASEVDAVPLAERSRLGAKLAAGEFITNVELLPPKGWSSDRLLEQARALQASGVDTVSILDGPRAQSRMGSIPTAIVVEREAGIEAVVPYTCRDRNMLGMLSDLLGAATAGLSNFLIVTGDPPRMGPYPDSTAVFDIDSIGLTNVVYRLNHGLDPGGSAIGAPTRFVIGVALNHSALDQERELRRLYWKVDAGADYVITQPVFDVDQFAQFLKRMEEYRIPVIAGVWPLVSLRNAEFLANEVPGQKVPPRVIERMRRAQEKGDDAALAEGIAIAREVLDAVKGLAQGAHVSAPLGRVEVAQQVLGS
jgi:homocysteine S-methyltransferase